jgi:hypothetical protein
VRNSFGGSSEDSITPDAVGGESAGESEHEGFDIEGADPNSDLVNSWAGQFETRPALGNDGEGPHDFQVDQVGPEETHVEATGVEVWADGINSGEALLQEAKSVGNPGASPYVPGSTASEATREGTLGNIDTEFEKYAAIIQDRNNPIQGLQIITNNSAAGAMFAEKMAEHGIPGRVDAVQWGPYGTDGKPL